MTWILAMVPRKWLIAGAVALVVVITAGLVSWRIYSAGYQAREAEALSGSVEVLRERNKVDDDVQGLDDDGLCRDLGGVPDDDGQCL